MKQLLQCVNQKSLIITPNQRLTTHIQTEYAELKLKNKVSGWHQLNLMPLSQWIETLWNLSDNFEKALLDENQLYFLFKKLIEAENIELIKTDETVSQVIEAMRRMILWQVSPNTQAFEEKIDTQYFKKLYFAYLDYCKANCLIDSFHVLKSFCEHFSSISAYFNDFDIIFLVGFTEIPPLWQSFLQLCEKSCQVVIQQPELTQSQVIRMEFQDFQTELSHAVQWLKNQHEINPQLKLALIIPGLNENRQSIENQLHKTFSLKDYILLKDKSNLPYNLSSGESLLSYSVIQTALQILISARKNLSLECLSILLKSSFIIGFSQEYFQRHALLLKLQNLNQQNFSQSFILQLFESHCPLLFIHFLKFIKLDLSGKRSITHWIKIFNQQLELMGWPGERKLSSQNYQLISRFKEVISELLSLESITGADTHNQVWQLLKDTTHKRLFQAKTGEKTLQVLGVLEALGIDFDKVWLLQCDNQNFPASANPSPFIPLKLQKQFNLPNASAEREFVFAENIFKQFKNTCKTLYVSSHKEHNQQPIDPSFLIASLPTTSPSPLPEANFGTTDLENFTDVSDLSIHPEDLADIKGGAGILKAQASCPFKAFAQYRLEAQAKPVSQPGLTALERGNIIHSALDFFWQRLKGSSELNTINHESLQLIIHECASAAVLSIHKHQNFFSDKFIHIEITRVINILTKWLEIEKKRENFTVVATEESLETKIDKLPLKLRIDRIDKLNNGALILIDYKTGLTSTNRWFGERIDEPQLPLYALVYPEAVDGIMFGQVRNNDFMIKGISNTKAHAYGFKNMEVQTNDKYSGWQNLKNHWEKDLTATAKAFLQGVATVDPKNGQQTCNLCDFSSFCRVAEINDEFN